MSTRTTTHARAQPTMIFHHTHTP